MGVTFKLIKYLGSVAKSDKAEKKLQICQWNGGDKVYDLRIWKADGKAASGISLSKEELLRIVELYNSYKENESVKKTEEDSFPINPPVEEDENKSVCNPETQTKTVAKEEKKEKLVQMPGTDIPQEEGRERGRKQSVNTEKPKETKSNIIQMPTGKKDIEVAKTSTSYTLEDCNAKLDELFNDVKDNSDYAYVLTGIKEMAIVDNDFVQNVMRESRTFKGMMQYAQSRCKEVGTTNGSCCVIDNDSMLALCLDYFNAKEEPKKEIKKSTTTKKSTKKTSTKAKKTKPVDDDGIDLDDLFD